MHVPKHIKEELGGGRKEFNLAEGADFQNIEDAEKFLTSADRQSVLLHFLNGLRAEKGDTVGEVKLREGEAIGEGTRCIFSLRFPTESVYSSKVPELWDNIPGVPTSRKHGAPRTSNLLGTEGFWITTSR